MSKDLVSPYSDRAAIASAINGLANKDLGGVSGFEGEVFSVEEKAKLESISASATANRADSANANKSHKHKVDDITGLNTIIEGLEARILALKSAGG